MTLHYHHKDLSITITAVDQFTVRYECNGARVLVVNDCMSLDEIKLQLVKQLNNRERNARRRERHRLMTDLGLVRVKGALGGTYYE